MIVRPILVIAVAAACASLDLTDAAAQPYPNRPIKLIVPFPAGGPPDTIARLVGSDISARLGQSVVIDNRAGGGATIGTRAVANAEADGYTLLFASTTSLSIGPALFKNLDYDPVKSFAPVASVSLGALVVSVNADVPAKTLPELVAYAKANPGKLHNGAGVASPPHIAWGLFTLATGTDIVFVPYRGMAQAMTDLVAGQIQMMIDGIGSLLPHIRDGKVRALAVTGRTRRSAGYPHHDRKRLSRLRIVVLDRDPGTRRHAGGHRRQAQRRGRCRLALRRGKAKPGQVQRRAAHHHAPRIQRLPRRRGAQVGGYREEDQHQGRMRRCLTRDGAVCAYQTAHRG